MGIRFDYHSEGSKICSRFCMEPPSGGVYVAIAIAKKGVAMPMTYDPILSDDVRIVPECPKFLVWPLCILLYTGSRNQILCVFGRLICTPTKSLIPQDGPEYSLYTGTTTLNRELNPEPSL